MHTKLVGWPDQEYQEKKAGVPAPEDHSEVHGQSLGPHQGDWEVPTYHPATPNRLIMYAEDGNAPQCWILYANEESPMGNIHTLA